MLSVKMDANCFVMIPRSLRPAFLGFSGMNTAFLIVRSLLHFLSHVHEVHL